MRIGFVVPGGVDRGGTHRVVPVLLNLIERVARHHSVCVFALYQYPGYERYQLKGATVVNIGQSQWLPRGIRMLDRLRRLVVNIRREEPRFDVLHAWFASEPGALAAAAGLLLRIPVITSVLGGEFVSLPHIDYGEQRSRPSRLLVSFAARHSAAITAPSMASVAQCSRMHARYVTLGVDCDLFTPPSCRPSPPPWRLLHVASVNRVKDQATLLRAFRLVIDAGFDARLDIVGEDTLNGAVQHLASELQLGGRVRFHGFVPQPQLATMYQQAQVYVHSSLHEGMPVSALEAAASGLPLVGTNVGLFRELAPAAAAAVAPGNPESMANIIVAILSNDSFRTDMANAALQFARRYDADWTTDHFNRLYKEVTT